MSDADLLDLLEILEELVHGDKEKAIRMISSFRTAIRQRMLAAQGKV